MKEGSRWDSESELFWLRSFLVILTFYLFFLASSFSLFSSPSLLLLSSFWTNFSFSSGISLITKSSFYMFREIGSLTITVRKNILHIKGIWGIFRGIDREELLYCSECFFTAQSLNFKGGVSVTLQVSRTCLPLFFTLLILILKSVPCILYLIVNCTSPS